METKLRNIVQLDLGKLPPQAVDIEAAILGALMIDQESFYRVILKPEYFYKEVHQKIFAAIQKLIFKNNPVDILTVTEELRKTDQLDEVGGPFYITQLTSSLSSSVNIEFHAKIVTQKYIQREVIRISTEAQQMAFDESIDPDDSINFLNNELERLTGGIIETDEPKTWQELIAESTEKAAERERNFKEGRPNGIPTPVYKLTKATTGFRGKQFIIIAARPGHGKTAWALGEIKAAAIAGYKPALFSLEMSNVSLTDRIVIGETGINADNYRSGKIESYEWELINNKIGSIYDWEVYIDDRPKSINRICAKAKQLHRKGKINILLIDYIQLATDDTIKANANREQEISTISRKLKLLSLELDIPVIAFSQLNRDVEKRAGMKIPMLSDLRESGSLEQDADIVGFLWNPAKYGFTEDEEGNPLDGRSFFILAKHREGQTDMIPFRYNDSITAIYDYEQDYKPSDLKPF